MEKWSKKWLWFILISTKKLKILGIMEKWHKIRKWAINKCFWGFLLRLISR
jgi:hypothetical protein